MTEAPQPARWVGDAHPRSTDFMEYDEMSLVVVQDAEDSRHRYSPNQVAAHHADARAETKRHGRLAQPLKGDAPWPYARELADLTYAYGSTKLADNRRKRGGAAVTGILPEYTSESGHFLIRMIPA